VAYETVAVETDVAGEIRFHAEVLVLVKTIGFPFVPATAKELVTVWVVPAVN